MFGAERFTSAVALILCLASGIVRAEINLSEVDEQGVFNAKVSYGNDTGIVARITPDDLFNLEKRQQCLAGYGTCPGGTTCGCPSATANCCQNLCKYLAQVCCTGPYICGSGEKCCGNRKCAPLSGQCCEDGRYCPSGSYCIRYEGETFDRCRVYGATSAYTRSTESNYATTSYAGVTSYTTTATAAATRYYTITYTVYYYYYYYYSSAYTIINTPTTIYSVRSSYTSTPTVLSAYATGSYDASVQLSSDVSSIQASFSSAALRSSSSMSSVVYSQSVAQASITAGSGGFSGGSAASSSTTSRPASTGASLYRFRELTALIISGFVTALIGGLALYL